MALSPGRCCSFPDLIGDNQYVQFLDRAGLSGTFDLDLIGIKLAGRYYRYNQMSCPFFSD